MNFDDLGQQNSQSKEEGPSSRGCGSGSCVCGGNGPAFSKMLQTMMPSGPAADHFKQARLEFLKGVRELIDQRIQSMSDHQSRGTKLNVE